MPINFAKLCKYSSCREWKSVPYNQGLKKIDIVFVTDYKVSFEIRNVKYIEKSAAHMDFLVRMFNVILEFCSVTHI